MLFSFWTSSNWWGPTVDICVSLFRHSDRGSSLLSYHLEVFFRTDLYHKNIRLSDTCLLHRDENLMNPLEIPKIGNVRPVDEFGNVQSFLGQTSTARVPRYLVRSPQSFPRSLPYPARDDPQISIIGFGERFLAGKMPGAEFQFHYQAPELVLSSQISLSADIWSLGSKGH